MPIISFNDPFARPWHFALLELVVVGGGIATLMHVLRARRAGDHYPAFVFASVVAYGLTIELLSYNFLDSFTHAQFTVMFYGGRLPLYVVSLYPFFITGAALLVRRLGVSAWWGPVVAGLTIVGFDVPFDIAGPDAGWWSWSATDPNLAARWLGVPVTSYYWHFAFGGALVGLCRGIWALFARRGRGAWAIVTSPLLGGLTIVVGVLAFLPFHALHALGVADGVSVALLLGLAAVGALRAHKRPAAAPAELIRPLFAYHLGMGLVVVALAASGVADAAIKVVVVLLVTGLSVTWQLWAAGRVPRRAGATAGVVPAG